MTKLLEIPVLFGLSIEVYFILLCIAIPTFLFWKWIFRKHISDKSKRNIAIWVSTIILSPLIYVGLLGIFIFIITREPVKDFDKLKWLANTEDRFEMGDDLVHTKILIGKDTTQVKQLLGQPGWKDSINQNWTYDMGMGRGGLGFLFHYLSLGFDKNKVVKVEHHRIKD